VKPMTALPRGTNEAAVGSIAAVLLIAINPGLPVWASYLVFWIPLMLAVMVSAYRTHGDRGHGVAGFQFRFTWFDILVGAFVGLLLRSVVIAIEILSVGHITSSASFFEVDQNLLWFASAIIAPALIAPMVEEIFFRGLVLPAIGANWLGIIGSAIIFSAMHLVSGFHWLTAATTFIAGIAFGALTVRTGRLGASVTAHIVYNASLVAMSELGGI
jgi:membrane protease YdiL (CAAX protease family)